jgi:hypothetical protein
LRLPIASFIVLTAVTACAHPARVQPAPLQEASLGESGAFGTGIVSATTSSVTLQLTASARIAVVRVFPGDSAQLAYPVRGVTRRLGPLGPGTQRIALWVERARDRRPNLSATPPTENESENVCRMRRTAYAAARPRDTLNPRRTTPFWDSCVSRPQHLDVHTMWTTVLGAPIQPGPHYLVVIATNGNVDPAVLAARLGELDVTGVSGDAAARAVPGYLLGETTRWAAWVAYRP